MDSLVIYGADGRALVSKAHETQAPYATALRSTAGFMFGTGKRGAGVLRQYADTNEFVRGAINRRKNQIGKASWKVVRIDDPKAAPDPKVVAAVTKLLKRPNPTAISWRSFIGKILEDVLILDAGAIEKEKTYGGTPVALWDVDGATIQVKPNWDGSDPNAPRYSQFIDGIEVTKGGLRNDQLVYIMAGETTHRPIGKSPVEWLLQTIETQLYEKQYSRDMLTGAPPQGLLLLPPGYKREQIDAWAEYYETEVAGKKAIGIMSAGTLANPNAKAEFVRLDRNSQEAELAVFREWLAKITAFMFELDPTVFGITGDVNRATAQALGENTDEGLAALAQLVQDYISSEIVAEFDERHGFAFDALNQRDAASQSNIDKTYLSAGVYTINYVRARDGIGDPVPWGDEPYNPMTAGLGARSSGGNGADNGNASGQNDPKDDVEEGGTGKGAVPFGFLAG